MSATIREELHQQINRLPDHIVEKIANFTRLISPEPNNISEYTNWQDEDWQKFALEQFFKEEDEIEYSLADAQEISSRHRDLLLALISSRLHQATLGFDEIINTSDSDYITTGLKVASLIRLGRLTSVESSVINARLGNISPERLIRIKNLLINWLRKSN